MAEGRLFLFLLVIAALLSGCTSVHWSSGPEDHTTIYACAQGTLSLPWTLSLSKGDVVENIKWFFSGRSQELIATEANGNYFITPAFSGRIHKTHNAGLLMNNMTVHGKGNYSVEVLVRTAEGSVSTLWRSVYVSIADSLQTLDGNLHVTMQPVAEYNNLTDQYHVVLRCGTFTYPTYAPFQATWLTPTEKSLASSSYQDGNFLLILPNPVQGGSYSCHVPPSSACLHEDTGVATLTVDPTAARLFLLETRQTSLEHKNKELENKNKELENKNRELENNNTELENRMHAMETEIAQLKGLENKAVGFHARLSADLVQPPANSVIVLGNVVTNVGGAYSPTTGKFAAPYNGTYYFIGTSEHHNTSGYIYIGLVVDDVIVDNVETLSGQSYQPGTVHAVVYLRAGQRVWLKSRSSSGYYRAISTAFSGFMVNYSP